MLKFLQPKEKKETRQLESFWNNPFLEELLIFKQGGKKIVGGRNFHSCA